MAEHGLLAFDAESESSQIAAVCRCGWWKTLSCYGGIMHGTEDVMKAYEAHLPAGSEIHG